LRAAFVNPDDPEAQALINSIVRHSASIRGTRPFWNGKRINLETYVKNIGCPAVFLTFSAADYHWDSLMVHLLGDKYESWRNGTQAQRIRLAREGLINNPHIAAYHFHRRFEALMDTILKPKFDVNDSWFHYEFQGRGSTHLHGFLWFLGIPMIIPEREDHSPEEKEACRKSRLEFAEY
jgi:Helitron helicase-like domain at N-terminus